MAQKNYELIITKGGITSTDPLFDINDLSDKKSKGCIFVDTYFEKKDGVKIRRNRQSGEKKKTNQVLPRLAFQIFEKDIVNLTDDKRKEFPICKYNPNDKMRCGIYKSEEEFHENHGKSYEFLNYDDNNTFYIYCWNIYSTLYFVWECLKRFGDEGDKFVLIYYRENEKDLPEKGKKALIEGNGNVSLAYQNKYSQILIDSKNVIFRGAPGTGKTFLAKKIATDIVTKGGTTNYEDLTDDQKEQIGFVQFHPSYDYSDFVEGLRPVPRDDGTLTFELKNGIFKEFVERAKENKNNVASLILCNLPDKTEEAKNYVFIVDEINRGEISKIFGELFFSIDPGYRGEKGKVATQYSNLHDADEEDFYIPDNVYIIGTMNDIDRSVDTFDFAMRRRFRFIEIKASENVEMLDNLPEKDEAIARMERLNEIIAKTDGFNENYQIGAAYFKKLENIKGSDKFEQLWNDYLQPLLQDYVTGMYNDKELMKDFKKAYDNETDQN